MKHAPILPLLCLFALFAASCATNRGEFRETITTYRPDGTVERVDETVIRTSGEAAGEAGIKDSMSVDYRGEDWSLGFNRANDSQAQGSELFKAAGTAFGAGINEALAWLGRTKPPKVEPESPGPSEAMQNILLKPNGVVPYMPKSP